ncbi:MAG: hypothetical protein KUA36_01540 [Desulfomicrobium sp.]|nr:hypothetical protein [Pseudomonadota bacterium]MBV1746823.1 hypothetical protein [Desulfomicrobium sp.]
MNKNTSVCVKAVMDSPGVAFGLAFAIITSKGKNPDVKAIRSSSSARSAPEGQARGPATQATLPQSTPLARADCKNNIFQLRRIEERRCAASSFVPELRTFLSENLRICAPRSKVAIP